MEQSTDRDIAGLKANAGKTEGRSPNTSVFSLVLTFSLLSLFALIPHLEHQVEAKTQKEHIRHPSGDQRR